MRLLKLHFKNINSLAGEWRLDFGARDFAEGLFALTGPTGAGKTSVLDAICLGLYGRTARLEISKEYNEVMTRGTGESFAQVEFEVDGKCYAGVWEQHRERLKPGGALQPPTRKLASLPDGSIIAEKIKEANDRILGLVGMDFKQFTRAVLLAQGQFDAFLKSDYKGRSAILEQVTGTEIYSKIGAAIFARFQTEKGKLEKLLMEGGYIKPMTDEDRAVVQKSLDVVNLEIKEMDSAMAVIAEKIRWLESLAKIKAEHAASLQEKERLDRELLDSMPDFDRLGKALAARRLDLLLNELDTARKALASAENDARRRKEDVEKCAEEIKSLEPSVKNAENAAAAAKTALEQSLPVLEEIRGMDSAIAVALTASAAAGKAEAEARDQLDALKAKQAKIRSAVEEAGKAMRSAKSYLDAHPGDDKLAEILPAAVSYLDIWKQKKTEAAARSLEYQKAEETFLSLRKEMDSANSAFLDIQEEHSRKKAACEKAESAKSAAEDIYTCRHQELEDKIRDAQANLDFVRTAMSLEDRRAQLEDGKACPLCGSKEHPFAAGNIPEELPAKKILEGFRKELKMLQDEVERGRKTSDDLQKEFKKSEKEFRAREKAKFEIEKKLEVAGAGVKSMKKAADGANEGAESAWKVLKAKLISAGLGEVLPEKIDRDFETLSKRRDDFERHRDMERKAAADLKSAEENSKLMAEQLEKADAMLADKAGAAKSRKEELAELRKKRDTKFTGDPSAEEKRLRQAFTKAEDVAAKLKSRLAQAETNLTTLRKEFDAAEKIMLQKRRELDALAEPSRRKFMDAGFADESACRSARWNDGDVERVAKLQEALKDRMTSINAILENSSAKIRAEEARALTDRPLAELQAEYQGRNGLRNSKGDEAAKLAVRLKDDDEIRTRASKHLELVEAQRKISGKWARLNSWIGGDGGEQFKRYAQGITLRHLLRASNRNLLKMSTGRYEMIWKASDESLLPSVLDHHQGSCERPVSNLSGGETFMVSLSLALGLAGMAGGKLRIDSLFLDEGFGTLDSNSLDIAVNTLAELHQSQGKLIGIISHIDQLKGRIPARIEITKLGGGRSTISGPGVERIAPAAPGTATAPKKKRRKNDPAPAG